MALGAVGVLALVGCHSGPAPVKTTVVTVNQLHLKFTVPAELADLTYRMGRSAEGQPAANFSTKALTAAGGPGCAAGAQNSVSPYPAGQIVLADETPAHVAEEAKTNPEDMLGSFVKKVGDGYLYYSAPPEESCAGSNQKAGEIQRRAIAALRAALRTVEAAP